MADFDQLSLGDQHSMILKQDGSVWSTALYLHGGRFPSLGVDKHFVRVIPSDAFAMAAGTSYSIVLKQDGSLWGMGRNFKGQLGDGTRSRKEQFFLVQKFASAQKAVAAGRYQRAQISYNPNSIPKVQKTAKFNYMRGPGI